MSAGMKRKTEASKTSPNDSKWLVWVIGMTQWRQMTRQWQGKAQTTRLHCLGYSMFSSSFDSLFIKLITNVLSFLSSNNHNYHAVVGTTTYDDKGTIRQQHRPSSLVTTTRWWQWMVSRWHHHVMTMTTRPSGHHTTTTQWRRRPAIQPHHHHHATMTDGELMTPVVHRLHTIFVSFSFLFFISYTNCLIIF